jgi:hypothetical protein
MNEHVTLEPNQAEFSLAHYNQNDRPMHGIADRAAQLQQALQFAVSLPRSSKV